VSPCSLQSDKQALEAALHHLTSARHKSQETTAKDLQQASDMVDRAKAKLREAATTIQTLTAQLDRYEAPPLSITNYTMDALGDREGSMRHGLTQLMHRLV
jgi:chromosome segregation ATPase